MGKSLSDNPFNDMRGFNINGIGISKEAIEENQKALEGKEEIKEVKTDKELTETIKGYIKEDLEKNINLSSEEKDELNEVLKNVYKDAIKEEDNESLEQQVEKYREKVEALEREKEATNKPLDDRTKTTPKNKTIYTKKTMIFKQEYLDIIDGLRYINGMEVKDVLNQLLEKAIDEIDEKTKERAIKEAQKHKTTIKIDKTIF